MSAVIPIAAQPAAVNSPPADGSASVSADNVPPVVTSAGFSDGCCCWFSDCDVCLTACCCPFFLYGYILKRSGIRDPVVPGGSWMCSVLVFLLFFLAEHYGSMYFGEFCKHKAELDRNSPFAVPPNGAEPRGRGTNGPLYFVQDMKADDDNYRYRSYYSSDSVKQWYAHFGDSGYYCKDQEVTSYFPVYFFLFLWVCGAAGLWLLFLNLRTHFKKRFNIAHGHAECGCCHDICMALCCGCCSLAQMARHLNKQGPPPSEECCKCCSCSAPPLCRCNCCNYCVEPSALKTGPLIV